MENRCKVKIGEVEIEGTADFVESILPQVIQAAKELSQTVEKKIQNPSQNSTVDAKTENSPEPEQAESLSPEEKVKREIEGFIKRHGVKRANEATTVIAYFLKERLGKNTITKEDLENFWCHSIKPPKNFSQLLSDTARKNNWIKKEGRKGYRITPQGVHLVKEVLKKRTTK